MPVDGDLLLALIDEVGRTLIEFARRHRARRRRDKAIQPTDPIAEFFQGEVERDPIGSVQARDMYRAYQAWCAGRGSVAVSETKFGRGFRQLCKRDDSGRARRYVRIRLRRRVDQPSTRLIK